MEKARAVTQTIIATLPDFSNLLLITANNPTTVQEASDTHNTPEPTVTRVTSVTRGPVITAIETAAEAIDEKGAVTSWGV